MQRVIAVTLASSLVLTGCVSSGLSPREASTGGQSRYLSTLYTDVHVADVQPQPFQRGAGIAVAQLGEVAPPQAMVERLRKESGLFARVEGIPATMDGQTLAYDRHGRVDTEGAPQRHLQALRGMAASMGMEYLLLVGGTVDQSTNNTPASVLNLTIIGAFIIPADKTQALVKASGALIEVRSGAVVSISNAEIDESISTPRVTGESMRIEFLKKLRDKVTVELAENVAADCNRRAATAVSVAK